MPEVVAPRATATLAAARGLQPAGAPAWAGDVVVELVDEVEALGDDEVISGGQGP